MCLIPMPPGTFHLSQWMSPRSLLVTDSLIIGATGYRCQAFVEGGRVAGRGRQCGPRWCTCKPLHITVLIGQILSENCGS
jgi:BarA-like signal transduction histidine kinase